MILFFGLILQFFTDSPASNHMHLAETFCVKQNNQGLHACKKFSANSSYVLRYDGSKLEKNAENRPFRHSSHIQVHSLPSGVAPV